MNISSLLKKSFLVILALILSLSLFACNSEPQTESTQVTTTSAPLQKIAVLSLELSENTQNAYDGFLSALDDNGLVDGENIELSHIVSVAEEGLSTAAESIVVDGVDLIYAIGVDAAIAAKGATAEIPVVFSCVEDPVSIGLVELCEKPEANVTGVCDYSPVFEQIELISTLYPDVERIGCLYNGADESAIFSANLASGEAQSRDITFTMYSSITESEFEDNLAKAVKKCDALYLTDDALASATLSSTLKKAKDNKIPVFAESTELVERGCLATCITDYEHIGYSAGQIGISILKGLKAVSDIPVEYATECTYVINADVKKSLKLEVPAEIEDKAVMVKTAD